MPANIIPPFRIPREDLAADLDRIAAEGIDPRMGTRVAGAEELRAEGFAAIFVAAGASTPRQLAIEGDAVPVVDALAFLKAAASSDRGASVFGRPRHVVVAGGGNTAMDAVRLALRLPGVEDVRLSYRRSIAQMPADREELENAVAEGGILMELSLPERSYQGHDGPWLSLRAMELGPKDSSGRRSSQPTDRSFRVACDLLVAAVGEEPDRAFLESFGLKLGTDGRPIYDPETQAGGPGLYVGGDAARGPASIIAAEADGRRAALGILRELKLTREPKLTGERRPEGEVGAGGAARAEAGSTADRYLERRGRFIDSLDPRVPEFAQREADRCLGCDEVCLRCVEVCPNRANFALPVSQTDGFAQGLQILHIDALCNECGNCGLFCPYEGEPFRGKPTLFVDREAMLASRNIGVVFEGEGAAPRLLVRQIEGAAPVDLSFEDWSAADRIPPKSDKGLFTMAWHIWFEHSYLIGGKR